MVECWLVCDSPFPMASYSRFYASCFAYILQLPHAFWLYAPNMDYSPWPFISLAIVLVTWPKAVRMKGP